MIAHIGIDRALFFLIGVDFVSVLLWVHKLGLVNLVGVFPVLDSMLGEFRVSSREL